MSVCGWPRSSEAGPPNVAERSGARQPVTESARPTALTTLHARASSRMWLKLCGAVPPFISSSG